MTLSDYIRKRRLDRAIHDLCTGDGKIIDIALKYRYDSAAAFSRSVKALTGRTPSAIRRHGSDVHFPKLVFEASITPGGLSLNNTPIVKIEEHRRERVVAFRVDCENP